MVNGQRVLVVDGMHEVHEVLRAVLAPRGLRVDWIRSHSQQLPGEAADRPDILVIDAEVHPFETSANQRHWNNVPQVILGGDNDASTPDADANHTYLRKPYLFPELIQAIERLLPKRAA